MDSNERPQFSGLVHQIADSLQVGAVLFDTDLQIIDATAAAKTMICLEGTIDVSLKRGTEETIGDNWKGLLETALAADQKTVFSKIPYRCDGKRLVLNVTFIPIRSLLGQVTGGVILIDDVSNRGNTHETLQIEKAAAIGRVAGKVAHELNNPLDGVLRYANLSLRMLEQNQPQKAAEYINQCKNGLQRMTQIINDMLEFSKSSHFALETRAADKLLEDAMRTLDTSLKTVDVQVVRKETGPLPHFRSELYQVFCNIIKNACDAMQGNGKLTIIISRSEEDWQFDFTDTGPGFEPFTADELFKPFFTTKTHGRGTGLGLSICRDILEKLGGHITAQSLADGGACFSIHLPAAAAQSRSGVSS